MKMELPIESRTELPGELRMTGRGGYRRESPAQSSREDTSWTAQSGLIGWLGSFYAASPWLAVTGWVMVAYTALSLVGLAADPALVDGAPAWLKPLKFGISTCLFTFTMAFVVGKLRRTRRFASVIGQVMAAALVLEIALIDMQAARHTSSHFNLATKFDGAVYGAMGLTIAVVLATTTALLMATFVERFEDGSLGLAIRLSLLLALMGMGVGGLMTLPTPQQLAAAHAGQGLMRVGGHTVGARDGGAAMPVTGWSADHGDLRIAHFLGLHAMQALLLAWWASRNRSGWSLRSRIALVWIVAASWLAAFALVLWQALRGEPLLMPASPTIAGWSAWLLLTLAGCFWISHKKNPERAR
jgi:hypothetical protein